MKLWRSKIRIVVPLAKSGQRCSFLAHRCGLMAQRKPRPQTTNTNLCNLTFNTQHTTHKEHKRVYTCLMDSRGPCELKEGKEGEREKKEEKIGACEY